MKKLFRQLKKNYLFRLLLVSVKFFTLFLFGICFVSFLSALTRLFNVADLHLDWLMFWSLRLVSGLFLLMCTVIGTIGLYQYIRTTVQRQKQGKDAAQVQAFEKAKKEQEAHGQIETHHPGYLGAQDSFYVGDVMGLGDVYQQSFVDTYSRVAIVKLYDRKTALAAADLLNDRVLPFFKDQKLRLFKIITDQGPEYCSTAPDHEYQQYLALVDIDHTQTRSGGPQANGICENFHQIMLKELYQAVLHEKIYRSLADLQRDVDHWLEFYNWERPHSGRYCYGKTPMQTFLDSVNAEGDKPAAERLQTSNA